MTHPFHPLFWRQLSLIDRRIRGTGGDRAYFYDDDGRLESMPISWTDLASEDPFVVASAGRAYFRVEDLLHLSALLEALADPAPSAAPQEEKSVK